MDTVIAKIRELIAVNSIETDDDRVETLITNFHDTPETVTLAVVKRAVARVNNTAHKD